MLLLIIAVLQTTAMPLLTIWGVMPELMLLVVVSWNVLAGMENGVLWALAGGMLLDALSGGPFGVVTISLVVATLVVGTVELHLQRDSVWLPLVTGVFATALYQVAYLVTLRAFNYPVPWVPNLVHVLLPSLVVNAVAEYPVFGALQRLHRRVVMERLQW